MSIKFNNNSTILKPIYPAEEIQKVHYFSSSERKETDLAFILISDQDILRVLKIHDNVFASPGFQSNYPSRLA